MFDLRNHLAGRDLDFLSSVSFCTAPGIGEGSSTSETPQPPRKKRARVDPTVESVCTRDAPPGDLVAKGKVAVLRNTAVLWPAVGNGTACKIQLPKWP